MDWYASCSPGFVQSVSEIRDQPHNAEGSDLLFNCPRCHAALVVDRAAAGMTLTCQHCGEPVVVPAVAVLSGPHDLPVADGCPKEEELRRGLKENESQRTEITGYINQLNIQLHRWQLRLQSLQERQTELQADLDRRATRPA